MKIALFAVCATIVFLILIYNLSKGTRILVQDREPWGVANKPKDPLRYFMVGYRLVNKSERYSMGNYFLWVDSPTYSGIRKMIYDDAKGDVPGAKIEDCVLLGMYEFPDSTSYFQFQRK